MRGINDRDKRALLKKILRDWNCDLICIQETKLEEVELADIRSIWGNQAVGFAVLKAIGAAGGILVLWNKNSFQLISFFVVNFRSLASCKWGLAAPLGHLLVFMVSRLELTNSGCGTNCDGFGMVGPARGA